MMRFRHGLMIGAAISAGAVATYAVGAPAKPKIYYGREVEIADFPWQVAMLEVGRDGAMRLNCGGILISPDHVLTAAHCVDEIPDNRADGTIPATAVVDSARIAIRAGATLYNRGGTLHEVAAITVHPQWKSTIYALDYDAAILQLKTPVRSATPVRLYRGAVDAGNGKAWVSGWGQTETSPLSNWLLAADVPIVRHENCNDRDSYGGIISPRMVCAGNPGGGKDSCSGDSGGPLVIGRRNRAALIGIVSWGDGCGKPEKYGVYARIDTIGRWISATAPSAVWTSTLEPGGSAPKIVPRAVVEKEGA